MYNKYIGINILLVIKKYLIFANRRINYFYLNSNGYVLF